MKKLVILFSAASLSVSAQLPETEIFYGNVDTKNNLLKIEKLENISNHNGYDNQPCFVNNDKDILFSSETETNNKTHICLYNIKSRKIKRLSITNTSEYSPMPLMDEKEFSVVMVEEDSTQRVWVFDQLSGTIKYCLSQQTDSVGYYTWLGKDSILYYKLTNPHSLRALNLKTHADVWLCDKPTRSFKKIDNNSFYYVLHGDKKNEVYVYDIKLKKATLYATDDNTANEDYVWNKSLGLLKSEGAEIYRYSADSKVWVKIADLSAFSIQRITRFAFSSDNKNIAIVSSAK